MSQAAPHHLQKGVDFIGVGVGAVIEDGQGKYFLSQRGPESRNERGLWEFPGGSVDFGETVQAALQREVQEEFGVVIEVGMQLDLINHILPDEKQHWLSPTFLCRIISGEPQIMEPKKCQAIAWMTLDEIQELIETKKVSQVVSSSYQELRKRS